MVLTMARHELKTFGEWLLAARTQARMSQDALAESAGISKNYISVLERNTLNGKGLPIQPSRQKVEALALALGRTPHEALRAAGWATPSDVLSRFPTAHSISNGEDVLARRVNGEIVTESNMDRAEKMLMRAGVLQEEAKQLQIDALRIIKGANQEE